MSNDKSKARAMPSIGQDGPRFVNDDGLALARVDVSGNGPTCIDRCEVDGCRYLVARAGAPMCQTHLNRAAEAGVKFDWNRAEGEHLEGLAVLTESLSWAIRLRGSDYMRELAARSIDRAETGKLDQLERARAGFFRALADYVDAAASADDVAKAGR